MKNGAIPGVAVLWTLGSAILLWMALAAGFSLASLPVGGEWLTRVSAMAAATIGSAILLEMALGHLREAREAASRLRPVPIRLPVRARRVRR